MTAHLTGTSEEWLAARLELLEAEKELRFFADWAAKKWPLRGSLKGPAGDL
jgi:predicted dithiol-disulfide oxidoreductase (DUF899 family)